MTTAFPESPFFVVGAQRSGSTLIRLMLDHHPQLAVPHEFDYLIDLLPESGWPDPAEIGPHLERSSSFGRSGLRYDASLPFPELAEDLLRQHQGAKRLVGGVVHAAFERIPRLWPEARFVHLVRDPRDVARSVVGMGWAGTVWHGAGRWTAAEESWERLQRTLPPGRFVEVRYEDLLRNPPGELARVCALLGVEYDEAMLRYGEDTTYRTPDPSRTEAWRRALSKREIRLVEARAGERLPKRGYEPSGLPPLRPAGAGRWILGVEDWWGRMRFRARRHGVATTLLDIAVRRILPLPGLRRRLRTRIRATADRSVQ